MIANAEILNGIQSSQIQQYVKRAMHHNQVGLSLGCKAGPTSENQAM